MENIYQSLHYRSAFVFLCNAVLPHAWWWELSVLVRKVALLLFASVTPDPVLQLTGIMLTVSLNFALLVKVAPYEEGMYTALRHHTPLSM